MRRVATDWTFLAFAYLIATLATVSAAQGTVIVNVSQAGGNVVFTGSGTLGLTAWTFDQTGTVPVFGGVNTAGVFIVGDFATGDFYGSPSGFSGPSSIGSGTPNGAVGGTGDKFGIQFVLERLIVPVGYSSGSPLSGSAILTNRTFSSLGLARGSYTWSWGSGASADSITLNIPEPSSVLLLGFGLMGMTRRRR